jgi:hypothetical protein
MFTKSLLLIGVILYLPILVGDNKAGYECQHDAVETVCLECL